MVIVEIVQLNANNESKQSLHNVKYTSNMNGIWPAYSQFLHEVNSEIRFNENLLDNKFKMPNRISENKESTQALQAQIKSAWFATGTVRF